MTPHIWTTEEVDGAHMGVGYFWLCSVCGASGGPKLGTPKESPFYSLPFYADGSGLELSSDCKIALQQITEHNNKKCSPCM